MFFFEGEGTEASGDNRTGQQKGGESRAQRAPECTQPEDPRGDGDTNSTQGIREGHKKALLNGLLTTLPELQITQLGVSYEYYTDRKSKYGGKGGDGTA